MHGKTTPDENELKTTDVDTFQPINIIIITCPKLVSKRLNPLIQLLNTSFAKGIISNFQVIVDDDINLLHEFPEFMYMPDFWHIHIQKGWLHYLENLVMVNSSNVISKYSYIDLDKETLFPKRDLTKVERSIIYRHYKAWKISSQQKGMTLILEDDAIASDENQLLNIIEILSRINNNDYFIDLCDSYIPINPHTSKRRELHGYTFSHMIKAKTRTLMAYMLPQALAQKIYNSCQYFSLPADMHLQIILQDLNTEGLAIVDSPFKHGSKNGQYRSSTEST